MVVVVVVVVVLVMVMGWVNQWSIMGLVGGAGWIGRISCSATYVTYVQ